MKPAKKIDYVPDPNKFDLVTDRWDSQGIRTISNPYRMFIQDGTKLFERPVNSGNLWYENNQPAGRVELEFNDKGHIIKKTFKLEAEHTAFVPVLKGAEKMQFELEQQRKRSAELEAELASIRGEREHAAEAKTVPQPEKAAAPTLTKRS